MRERWWSYDPVTPPHPTPPLDSTPGCGCEPPPDVIASPHQMWYHNNPSSNADLGSHSTPNRKAENTMPTSTLFSDLPPALRRAATASRNSTKFLLTHSTTSNRLEDICEAAFNAALDEGYSEAEVIDAMVAGDASADRSPHPRRLRFARA